MNINEGYKTDAGCSRYKTHSTHRGRLLSGVHTIVENVATILQYEHLSFRIWPLNFMSLEWFHNPESIKTRRVL